jgi:hypothetical protein
LKGEKQISCFYSNQSLLCPLSWLFI